MRRVEVNQQRLIFDDVFKVEEAYLRYERYDGTMGSTVRRINLERGDSVAAIIVDRSRKSIYLTEQFRYPTFANGAGWIIEVAAGTVEPGEDNETAITREVLEELGFVVEAVNFVARFYLSPGGSSERIHLFCAVVSASQRRTRGGGLVAEGEDILVLEWPVEEFFAKLDQQELTDAKTIIAAYWLKDNWARICK
jgi:nudix-type nucleoside diphosphatase (YffH/AdpP family)